MAPMVSKRKRVLCFVFNVCVEKRDEDFPFRLLSHSFQTKESKNEKEEIV